MNVRLDNSSTEADPVVGAILVATLVLSSLGVLLLMRAQFDGSVGHVTVRVDNQTGLALDVDARDARGGAVGLGQAAPRTPTTFREVPDIGRRWTFVASYGGREVYREQLLRDDLVADGWTVQVPASATAALERAGFR
jgi:hypothetical protein